MFLAIYMLDWQQQMEEWKLEHEDQNQDQEDINKLTKQFLGGLGDLASAMRKNHSIRNYCVYPSTMV